MALPADRRSFPPPLIHRRQQVGSALCPPKARNPSHCSPHKHPRSPRRQQAGSAEGIMPFARRRPYPSSSLAAQSPLRLLLSARVLHENRGTPSRSMRKVPYERPSTRACNSAAFAVRQTGVEEKWTQGPFRRPRERSGAAYSCTPPARAAMRSIRRGSGGNDPSPFLLFFGRIRNLFPNA